MKTKTYYITTPLYYVNDVPHIGHAYTTIAADVAARWKRMNGHDVFFLTGTDEHGAKIAQVAEKAGLSPQGLADKNMGAFDALWKRLGIAYDDFIRTTEPRHVRVVQAVFERLRQTGDIFKGFYEDWYCVSDETFWSEAELVDGRCPTCGRAVEKLKEESYYFRLSKYEKPLLDYFEKNPDFLQPSHRASEIKNFVKGGLTDLSVSRTKVAWGVPVPSDKAHTVYVWFDALLNYITAPGYDASKASPRFDGLWPADVHLVGKEIFRFHTVIWPAMLMALGLPLPRRVFAHGWWTVEGQKMSKSVGNVVNPHDVADAYGVDALRYFVLREVPFGSDGDFSQRGLLSRYNAELANALGNLLNRTLNLVEKNAGGKIPAPQGAAALLTDQAWGEKLARFDGAIARMVFHEALEEAAGLVNGANKFIDEKAPWKTAKTDLNAARHTLWEVARAIKAVTVLLHPFMPTATAELWRQLGEATPLPGGAAPALKGDLSFASDQLVSKGQPLFPRKEATS